jgi:hypothetical protein
MENLITRVKEILLQPKAAWEVIKNEETSVAKIMTGYVLPLALIPAIASLIGYWLVGVNVPFFGKMASFEWGLNVALSNYLGSVIGVFITGWVISKLAPTFNASVSIDNAVKMVAYSYTPVFVVGILNIAPSLAVISLFAGIYGLYILYLGFEPITNVGQEKKTSYFVVSILVLIGVYIVLGIIIGTILGALGISAMNFNS